MAVSGQVGGGGKMMLVVVNVIYCDNNFMVIGKEHVFQIISHNYTT